MMRLIWQYAKFLIYPIGYLLVSPFFIMYLGIEDAWDSLKDYQYSILGKEVKE